MELSVVGDFDPVQLEECIIRYVGTVGPRYMPPESAPEIPVYPFTFQSPAPEARHQSWHLKVRRMHA